MRLRMIQPIQEVRAARVTPGLNWDGERPLVQLRGFRT
jgi:hypothetical protein